MTEPTAVPIYISCDDVTTHWDREVAEGTSSQLDSAIEEHLAHCQDCQQFVMMMTGLCRLSELHANASPGIHFIPDVTRKRKRQRFASLVLKMQLAAIFGLVVLIAYLVIGVPAARQADPIPPEPFTVLQCTPSEPAEIVPGVFMSACQGTTPAISVNSAGDITVSFEKGAVGLQVNPNRPARHGISVRVPQGVTRVKGTVFTVLADEKAARVEVFRGIVEIESNDNSSGTFHLKSGYGAILPARRTYTLTRPVTIALQRKLKMHSTVESPSLAPERSDERNRSNASIAADALMNNNSFNAQRETKPHTRQQPTSFRELIQDAQSCLIDQDWICAAQKYQEVLKTHSHRPEATVVLISIAKLELRHLKDPASALEHYRMYQRKSPSGPLAEEAAWGVVQSQRQLGNRMEELRNLNQFVQQFPDSVYVSKVRLRLKELNQ
jgi:hypothetical protein